MAACEYVDGCPFFADRVADPSGLAVIYKRRYCNGDSTDCACHRVARALGMHAIPDAMHPNDRDWARAILRDKAGTR